MLGGCVLVVGCKRIWELLIVRLKEYFKEVWVKINKLSIGCEDEGELLYKWEKFVLRV